MLNFLRTKISMILAGIMLLSAPLAVPAVVLAAPTTPVIQDCVGQGSNLKITSGHGACDTANNTANGTNKVNNLVTDIVNVFSLVVGIISVIMLVFGGFQYITSGGDTSKVSTAKTTIIYAIVGLILVAFAQFLVQFILNKVVGTS